MIFYAYEMKFYIYGTKTIEYRQLLFGGTHPNLQWLKEGNVRYVSQKKTEEETVKAFEKKYSVQIKYGYMGKGDDTHMGYEII